MSAQIALLLFHFIKSFISATGYGGVLLLMAIESACVPLPSEVIMPFAGFLVQQGQMNLFWVATVGALGCNLGSAVAYWVGAWGGRPFLERYGRYVLLNLKDLDRADSYFHRFGGITVFVGRLLPVVRTFIALPAGIARMPQWRFHLYTFLGSWPWCFVLAYIGVRLGRAWETNPRFRAFFHRFQLGVEILVVAAVVWFVWSHWRNRSRSDEA